LETTFLAHTLTSHSKFTQLSSSFLSFFLEAPICGHTGFIVDRHYRATNMEYVNIHSAHLKIKSEVWASASGTVLLISSSTSSYSKSFRSPVIHINRNYSLSLHVMNVNFCSYLEYDIQCDVVTYIRKKPYKRCCIKFRSWFLVAHSINI